MADDVVSTASSESRVGIDYFGFLKRRWTPEDYAKALMLLGLAGTVVFFYGILPLYQHMPITTWAWARFAPQYNFEHGKLVPLIFAFLVWYHRDEISKAKKEGCNQGLIWVALGCLLFAIGVRTIQARLGMAAAPVLLYGIVLYLWGKEVARILLFPIVFLVFMIPVSAIEQATFRLQFLVTGIAKMICGGIGIPLYAEGTMLRPLDQSYNGFDVAEGCSGIRSLMAMVMVTAIYVHLTQNKLWKQVVILLCSTGFAIIGNAGRIVSIFIVARFFGSAFAGGPYHEYSGYVSFPIALGAMLLLSRVLDLPIFDTKQIANAARALKPGEAQGGNDIGGVPKKNGATYDY